MGDALLQAWPGKAGGDVFDLVMPRLGPGQCIGRRSRPCQGDAISEVRRLRHGQRNQETPGWRRSGSARTQALTFTSGTGWLVSASTTLQKHKRGVGLGGSAQDQRRAATAQPPSWPPRERRETVGQSNMKANSPGTLPPMGRGWKRIDRTAAAGIIRFLFFGWIKSN